MLGSPNYGALKFGCIKSQYIASYLPGGDVGGGGGGGNTLIGIRISWIHPLFVVSCQKILNKNCMEHHLSIDF